MLDGVMRRVIDPVLNVVGRRLAARGIGANAITLTGLVVGLAGALGIAASGPWWAVLTLVLVGRILDGLDGAVARAGNKTDFGGYFDIVCDFVFYAAVPLAFVLRAPEENGLAGAFLLVSFYVNGATFLGYAVLAEKRRIQTCSRGDKSLYFSAGLLEGTETISFFVVLCLWPAGFVPLAFVFGALCLVTAFARVVVAARSFRT